MRLMIPPFWARPLPGPTWQAWRSTLLATMGEPLTPEELESFTKFTGRTTPPSQRVDELWSELVAVAARVELCRCSLPIWPEYGCRA